MQLRLAIYKLTAATMRLNRVSRRVAVNHALAVAGYRATFGMVGGQLCGRVISPVAVIY